MGKTDFVILLGEDRIANLDFADDVVIFAETLEFLVHALDTLAENTWNLSPLD